jgi:uncharacterized protein DUF3452
VLVLDVTGVLLEVYSWSGHGPTCRNGCTALARRKHVRHASSLHSESVSPTAPVPCHCFQAQEQVSHIPHYLPEVCEGSEGTHQASSLRCRAFFIHAVVFRALVLVHRDVLLLHLRAHHHHHHDSHFPSHHRTNPTGPPQSPRRSADDLLVRFGWLLFLHAREEILPGEPDLVSTVPLMVAALAFIMVHTALLVYYSVGSRSTSGLRRL